MSHFSWWSTSGYLQFLYCLGPTAVGGYFNIFDVGIISNNIWQIPLLMYTMSKNVGCNESHPSLWWTREMRHVRIEVEKERRRDGEKEPPRWIITYCALLMKNLTSHLPLNTWTVQCWWNRQEIFLQSQNFLCSWRWGGCAVPSYRAPSDLSAWSISVISRI